MRMTIHDYRNVRTIRRNIMTRSDKRTIKQIASDAGIHVDTLTARIRQIQRDSPGLTQAAAADMAVEMGPARAGHGKK